jgi:transcriptional regulator with XRE-family HTH domain
MLGISRSTYANYESGKRSPDLETLEHISDALDCSMDALFGRAADRNVLYTDRVCEERRPYQTDTASGSRTSRRMERKLLIGAQDFRFLRERNAYYVDKTQMVEEFLESWYQVTLVTRPRRFGKTLNMSMLAEFLDCTKESEGIFEDTKISRSRWAAEMNRHPVVFLSFLNVKASAPDELLRLLGRAVCSEYRRYYSLISSSALPEEELRQFYEVYSVISSRENAAALKEVIGSSIVVLCNVLELYFGRKVYLLLDEYDTPFISANSGGYYSEVRDVLAGMLSFALKGNPSIEKALLTGIQRVAKENIFSGLNNLVVCTAADADYADCFGFTEKETRELLEYCGGQFTDEVRDMYDGYRIGDCELYNPWSVSCYCARKRPESYWVNTGENSILKNALAQQRSTFAEKYNTLVEEGKITVKAELSTAYYEKPNDASLWGLLINAGMVTIEERKSEEDFTVRVPNQEVWKAFQELTAFYLQVDEYEIGTMLGYLKTGDIDKFAEAYRKVLLELPSYHDLKDENSYHMMMLGMCTFLRRDYDVRSNRESGNGRGDILLYTKKPVLPNLVLEFKYTKDHSKDLEELATDAVRQIKEKNYCADMQGETVLIGLAHCGKQAAVTWEK